MKVVDGGGAVADDLSEDLGAGGGEGVQRDGAGRRALLGRRDAVGIGVAVVHLIAAADRVGVARPVVDLVPGAERRARADPLTEEAVATVGLHLPTEAAEVDVAARVLQVERVLDEREAVLFQARLLELFKLRLVELRLVADVVAAGLDELREDDRAADLAGVRHVVPRLAVLHRKHLFVSAWDVRQKGLSITCPSSSQQDSWISVR